MRTVVGLFDRIEDAQAAVRDLRGEGFVGEDISLVARDASGEFQRYNSSESGTKQENIGDSTAKGVGIGAMLGGIGGLLVGLGALAIPGVGPVLAAGPIAAALAGAGMGAVAGGMLGALIDMGIPDEHAEIYAEGVRRGSTLVVLRSQDDRADRAVAILNAHDPVDVERRAEEWRGKDWTGFNPDADPLTADQMEFNRQNIPVTGTPTMTMDRSSDTTTPVMDEDLRDEDRTLDMESNMSNRDLEHGSTIPIIEEDIQVGKRQVDKGGVQINTHIEETPVNEEVRLRREQVNVERRPVDRPATDADFDQFKEGTMEFKETEERPVVQKTSRVVEEIHVDKTVNENVEQIHDTVRRTGVDVSRTGDNQNMSGSRMKDWNQYDSVFRNHFNSSYGSSGHDYSYYMPAYQYGYQIANDPRYSGYEWDRMEQEARSDWQMQHHDSLWDDIRDAVRYAWESVRR